MRAVFEIFLEQLPEAVSNHLTTDRGIDVFHYFRRFGLLEFLRAVTS
ncbi:hypothetical protein QFZ88_003717 [Mesorhizobium sp. YL-MeA3-2017]|jgi:hypothetical protein|nr:hypothetical protein [Mesorhizobium sp. YL-MeA3-2017]